MKAAFPLLASLAFAAGCDAPAPSPPAGTAASDEPARLPADADAAVPAPDNAAAAAPRLAVEGEGLRWFLPPNGSARPLPFGTAQADVLASLERVRGEAAEGTNQDCGAGPVAYANWADGLSLVFQDGRFAGWGLDGRAAGALATADNVGPGTTRAQLDEAVGSTIDVRQSTLGTEFTAGGYSGLLDGTGPNARITDMWAGVSCAAR